jgi:hypothetical protein
MIRPEFTRMVGLYLATRNINSLFRYFPIFDPHLIRENAKSFPRSRFEYEFKKFVAEAWEQFLYKNKGNELRQ